MTQMEFETQVTRLKSTWGERNYPTERIQLIWRAIKNTPNDWFTSAVDSLIANERTAPMVEDIAKAIDLAKNRFYSERNNRGVTEVLENAANETSADPELVKACLKTLSDFQTGKIDKKTFLEACDALDNIAAHIAQGKRTRNNPRDRQAV